MAPRRKESKALRDLYIAAARMEQLEVNFRRGSYGGMKWREVLRRGDDASAEIIRILRRLRHAHRNFIREGRLQGASHRGGPKELEQWYNSVRNDIEEMDLRSEMIDRVAEFYQDAVYHPFLDIHRRMPRHPIWELNERLTAVEMLLQALREVVRAASEVAEDLSPRYRDIREACDSGGRGSMSGSKERKQMVAEEVVSNQETMTQGTDRSTTVPALPRIIEAPESMQPENTTKSDNPLGAVISASSSADEKLKHRRAATTANYVPTGPPAFGSVIRRHGRSVPRIFTGSSSELEASLREMKLADDRDEAAPITRIGSDFAALGTTLSRPDQQGHGVVMISRRGALRRQPNDRIRAKTMDETTGNLDIWLNERPPPLPPLPPLPSLPSLPASQLDRHATSRQAMD